MAEANFNDLGAAEAWFEKQTPKVRSTITCRAALRVAANLGRYEGEGADALVLTAMRCTLTSAVRGLGRTADVDWLERAARSATLSAAHSAHSAHSARSAAHSARSAAHSAHSALSAALSATQWDSNNIGVDLNTHPLWADVEVPRDIVAQHDVFLTRLRTTADWNFFRTWYEQMWEGTFTDWDLATEVAKIDNEVWDAGLRAVAEAIRGIEARRRTQITVPIVRNKSDTAFELANEEPLPDELLQYVKERVGGALRTALDSGGNNGFDENCPEAIAVLQALQSVNPSAVAGLLNDASLMFQTNLGDLYPNDGALIALQSAAFSGPEEICEIDELARKRCLRASQLYLRENPEPIDGEELKDFTEIVAAEATDEAEDIIRSDGRAIALGKKVGRFNLARFANYTTTIVEWIDKTKKGSARVEWLWEMVKKLLGRFQDPPA